MTDVNPRQPSEEMLVCIQNCQDCYRACLQTMAYCLRQGGRHAEPEHLRLMMDCADICHTAANFMIRGSDLHAHTCAACSEVCLRCAEDCRRLADDPRMKACADTCQHCADSCRHMAGGHMMAAGHMAGEAGSAPPPVPVSASQGPSREGAVMSRRKTH